VPSCGETEKATSSPGKSEFPLLKTFQFATVKVDANGNVTERRKGEAQAYSEVINGAQLEMVLIPAGTFQMGSPVTEKGRNDNEDPRHQVTVPQFYIGKFEVTQAQWRALAKLPKVNIDLKPDPSEFKGDNLPVEKVSWDEAVEFCARLSKATGRDYRLPSESEWEHSARAGTQTPYAFGETITREIVNSEQGAVQRD
jgi:formylglycine-generating enzyme required for sulfatase activity